MGWKPGSTKRSYDGNEPLQGAYTRVGMGLGILTKNTGHLRGPAALSESCDVVYHASRANITQILKSFRAHSGSTVLHSARALRSARSRGLPAGFCRRRSHLRPRRTQFPHGSPSHSHRMPRSVGLCQGIWVGFALGKGALRTFVTANVTSLARQTGTARAHFHALLLLLDLLLL